MATQGARVQKVANRVRRASLLSHDVYIVEEIDGEVLQAAAVYESGEPRALITRRLVGILNDEELAWLIAHEFAHLELQHRQKMEQKEERDRRIAHDEIMKEGRRRAAAGQGYLKRFASAFITSFVATAASEASLRFLSQKHEREADEWACRITKHAGYDPAAGARVLLKLHHGNVPEITMRDILSTHPSTKTRMEEIKKYAQSLSY